MPHHSWEGFLPRHSVQMLREPTPTPSLGTPATLSPARILWICQGHQEPAVTDLLEKMVQATAVARRDILIVDVDAEPAQSTVRPEFIVVFGQSHPSHSNWTAGTDIPVLTTLHPREIASNPAAKREIWTTLKRLMSMLAESDRI